MPGHALVGRTAGQDVDRPLEMAGHRRRQDLGQLLEGGAGVRVVAVGELHGQARGQEKRHGLVQGQAQRRQKAALDDPPFAALAPHRDADLALEGLQIAVDGPARHGHEAGDRIDRGALGMGLQVSKDAVETCQPIALGGLRRVRRRRHLGTIRSAAARSRYRCPDLWPSCGPRRWQAARGRGSPKRCR